MKPPKCRVCETEHWLTQPHEFKAASKVSELLTPRAVVNAPAVVVNKLVHAPKKSRATDRHKSGRNEYHRENMRKVRAAKRLAT